LASTHTSTAPDGTPRWFTWASLGVVLIAAVLTLTDLGRGGLRNGDEARYALVAENILLTGDAVTLTYEGEPYFQKAPARFWLSALGFRLWGVNEITIRLWSALAGVGAVWGLILLGRRLSGPLAGVTAGLALATMPGFLHVHGARTGEMDTALVFFWILAIGFLLRPGDISRNFLYFCLCAAAGGLVKHLVFAPVILLLGLGYLLFSGRWRALRPGWVAAGLGAWLLLLAPWHLAQWQIHGNLFWRVYFGRVVVETALNPVDTDESRGFYLGVLLAGTWPWLWAVLLHGVNRLRCRWRQPEFWLPFLWLGGTLLLATVAQRKLAWYALPAYPAVALMVGRLAARVRPAADDTRPVWHLAVPLLAVASLALAGGVNSARFAASPAYQVQMDAAFLGQGGLAFLGVGLGVGLAAWFLLHRRPARASGMDPARALLGLALGLLVVYGGVNAWQARPGTVLSPWRDLLSQTESRLDADTPLLIMLREPRWRDDVRLYYLRRLAGRPSKVDEVEAAQRLADPAFTGALLLAREDLPRLARRLPRLLRETEAWTLAGNEAFLILSPPATRIGADTP